MDYEEVLQNISEQLSSAQQTEVQDVVSPSAQTTSDHDTLNMIALEIKRKGGY